jgi:hypothetical protein
MTASACPRVRRVFSRMLSLNRSRLYLDLANKVPSSFEPVAEELERFPGLPAVADMRLVGMQTQAVFSHPGTNLGQSSIGLFAGLAQHLEVVRIAHHAIAAGCHQFVQRMQVEQSGLRAATPALSGSAMLSSELLDLVRAGDVGRSCGNYCQIAQ